MAEDVVKSHSGSCYCGQVKFQALSLSDIWYCHCTQCRKMTGHYLAAAGTKQENLTVSGEIEWRPVSENSSYGRCEKCHSIMFWRNITQDTVSVLAGALHDTDDLEVKGHIFVAFKGPYYDITDGLPQFDEFPPGGVRKQGFD